MSFSSGNHSERRLSMNGRNAYVFVNVEENSKENKNTRVDDSLYLTAKQSDRARSLSPALFTKGVCTTKENLPLTAVDGNMVTKSKLLVAPEGMLNNSPPKTKTCTVSTNPINHSTGAIPKNVQPKYSAQKPQIQVGIDRYITVLKRGRSPRSSKIASTAKVPKDREIDRKTTENRFSILQDETADHPTLPKSSKPPPIYLREQNSNALIKNLISLVGENSFYVVPFKRGNISETKIQVNHENDFRKVVTEFENNKQSFYTYQLKSSKGLQIVIKGIDSCVDPEDIKAALEHNKFKIKNVVNIRNRAKIPQAMFRVELEPGDVKLKKNETHPIYNLK